MTSSPSLLLLPVEERTTTTATATTTTTTTTGGETVGEETVTAPAARPLVTTSAAAATTTTAIKSSTTTIFSTKHQDQNHDDDNQVAAGKSAADLLAQFQETYGRAQSNMHCNEPNAASGRCLLPGSRSSSTSSSSTSTNSDILRDDEEEEEEDDDDDDFKEEDFVNLSEDTTTMMVMTLIRFWHIFLSVLSCCCLPLSLLGWHHQTTVLLTGCCSCGIMILPLCFSTTATMNWPHIKFPAWIQQQCEQFPDWFGNRKQQQQQQQLRTMNAKNKRRSRTTTISTNTTSDGTETNHNNNNGGGTAAMVDAIRLMGGGGATMASTAATTLTTALHHHNHHHHHHKITRYQGGGGGGGNGSRPPTAFVCLAVLTMVTLIVHPDGYTWVMLRKLRNALLYVVRSSVTGWAIVMNDYGAVVSTALALATFASLFFFAYVLKRTLTKQRRNNDILASSSSTTTTTTTSSTKKKKRRAHHHNNHSKNNTRGVGISRTNHSTGDSRGGQAVGKTIPSAVNNEAGSGCRPEQFAEQQSTSLQQQEQIQEGTGRSNVEQSTFTMNVEEQRLSSTERGSEQTCSDDIVQQEPKQLPALLEDEPLSPPRLRPERIATRAMEISSYSVGTTSKIIKGRDRTVSTSTVDTETTLMSVDDQSHDSVSVSGRSTPTASPLEKPIIIKTNKNQAHSVASTQQNHSTRKPHQHPHPQQQYQSHAQPQPHSQSHGHRHNKKKNARPLTGSGREHKARIGSASPHIASSPSHRWSSSSSDTGKTKNRGRKSNARGEKTLAQPTASFHHPRQSEAASPSHPSLSQEDRILVTQQYAYQPDKAGDQLFQQQSGMFGCHFGHDSLATASHSISPNSFGDDLARNQQQLYQPFLVGQQQTSMSPQLSGCVVGLNVNLEGQQEYSSHVKMPSLRSGSEYCFESGSGLNGLQTPLQRHTPSLATTPLTSPCSGSLTDQSNLFASFDANISPTWMTREDAGGRRRMLQPPPGLSPDPLTLPQAQMNYYQSQQQSITLQETPQGPAFPYAPSPSFDIVDGNANGTSLLSHGYHQPPGLSLPAGGASPLLRPIEQPSDTVSSYAGVEPDNLLECATSYEDLMIEAELQELGGRMVGSVLDSWVERES